VTAKVHGLYPAARRSVAALRKEDRLDPADEVTAELVLALARRLDEASPEVGPAQVASLARALLASVKHLTGSASDDSDALGDLLAALSGPLGDAAQP
jgi:hypothetical protein